VHLVSNKGRLYVYFKSYNFSLLRDHGPLFVCRAEVKLRDQFEFCVDNGGCSLRRLNCALRGMPTASDTEKMYA
jgi:hypothetical protein